MKTEILETELYEMYISSQLFKKGVSFEIYKKSFLQSRDSKGLTLNLNIVNVENWTENT